MNSTVVGCRMMAHSVQARRIRSGAASRSSPQTINLADQEVRRRAVFVPV